MSIEAFTKECYILVGYATSLAFRELIAERHLYQSIEISLSNVEKLLLRACGEKANRSDNVITLEDQRRHKFEAVVRGIMHETWTIRAEGMACDLGLSKSVQESKLVVPLNGVRLFCPRCKREEPHNPGTNESWGKAPSYNTAYGQTEVHLVPFQCQGCQLEPVVFMIQRKGAKLTLCGRLPIESVNVPDALPVPESEHFSSAVLAFQCGQILPSIFMLRTFIEQIWERYNRAFGVLLPEGSITADEKSARYQNYLTDDFKRMFPSLTKVYGNLSSAMHKADANAGIFEACRSEIVRHFEARKLLGISEPQEVASFQGPTSETSS